MKINSEKGQALVLAMIAVMLGALVVPPFLGHVGTGLIGSRNYMDLMETQYACDSGAEHAIWSLVYGGLMDSIPDPGDTVSYYLDETVNGEDVHVIISNTYDVIAWDDFESGGWTGGGGWLDDWAHSGDASVTSSGEPYDESDFHLRLRDDTGVATRSVDLSDYSIVHLRFWAKVDSFETWDRASCLVSPNGTDWTTIYTWDNWDSDGDYHVYELDLTAHGLSEQFYISFQSDMSSTGDYFYVDDINVLWLAMPVIPVAEDDFESGDWAGGTGWSGNWTYSGNAVVNSYTFIWPWSYYYPHDGYYQAELRGPADGLSGGDIMRPVDLSGQVFVRLRFWARAINFDPSDQVLVRVSSDGGLNWDTVYTFGNGEDTGEWRYYDLDLSGYELTEDFWIRFDADQNRGDEYFWLDDINLNMVRAFCITVTVGDRVLKVTVDLLWDQENIMYWSYQA